VLTYKQNFKLIVCLYDERRLLLQIQNVIIRFMSLKSSVDWLNFFELCIKQPNGNQTKFGQVSP
jgi:hypothetical protein